MDRAFPLRVHRPMPGFPPRHPAGISIPEHRPVSIHSACASFGAFVIAALASPARGMCRARSPLRCGVPWCRYGNYPVRHAIRYGVVFLCCVVSHPCGAQRLESFAEATKGGSAASMAESPNVGIADTLLFEPQQRPGTPEGSPERRRSTGVGSSMLAANLSERLDAFEDKMKSTPP